MPHTAAASRGDGGLPRRDRTATAASAAEGTQADAITGADAGIARRAATDAERRAVASVLRLRILRLCLYEELTNRQLADRLDRHPATMLHHVRTLVDQGFLVATAPRRGRRGSREIPYRATKKSWAIDFDDAADDRTGTDTGDPAAARAETSRVLLHTFLAEIADIEPGRLDTTRLGLQMSPDDWAEFTDRLAALLDEYARRPHEPGGQRRSVFIAMHPEPEPREPS